MPTIHFIQATPSNTDSAEFTVVFTYQQEGADGSHTIRVAGQGTQATATEEENNEVIQLLFAGALLVIETSWDRQKQLPDETKVYRQNDDFPVDSLTRIPWQGYELILPN